MMRWLPQIRVGVASGPMVNEDDGEGRYLIFEWFNVLLLIEILRRRP